MSLLTLLPLLSALTYALGSFAYKKAGTENVGSTRLYFIQSQVSLPLFLFLSIGHWDLQEAADLIVPIYVGLTFFCGWLFTLFAIKSGDVSLQTPLMGMKVAFVALLAAALGLSRPDTNLWGAVILASVAVFILGFPRRRKEGKTARTVGFVTISCLFFAASDVLIGAAAADFGLFPFLAVVVVTNAVLSFGLFPFFQGSLTSINPAGWKWSLIGAGLMTLQILTLTSYMGITGEAAIANVLFSTRGLFAVALGSVAARFLALPSERLVPFVYCQRMIGALLMVAAVTLVFV
ncbi:MAG: EamA family transporter [Puniceicoccaceae bacterium]